MKFIIIPFFLLLSFVFKNQDLHHFKYETIYQEKELKQSIKDGSGIYSEFCIRCHLGGGEGVEEVYPPLANSNWLSEKRTESIKSVKFGLNGEIEVNGKIYNNNMTSMGLTDREVADVMNYIMNSFGNESNKYPQVTLEEVSKLEKN